MTTSIVSVSVEEAYSALLDAKAAARFANDVDEARREVARRRAQWLTAIRLDVASRPTWRIPAPTKPLVAAPRRSNSYRLVTPGRSVTIPPEGPFQP